MATTTTRLAGKIWVSIDKARSCYNRAKGFRTDPMYWNLPSTQFIGIQHYKHASMRNLLEARRDLNTLITALRKELR